MCVMAINRRCCYCDCRCLSFNCSHSRRFVKQHNHHHHHCVLYRLQMNVSDLLTVFGCGSLEVMLVMDKNLEGSLHRAFFFVGHEFFVFFFFFFFIAGVTQLQLLLSLFLISIPLITTHHTTFTQPHLYSV